MVGIDIRQCYMAVSDYQPTVAVAKYPLRAYLAIQTRWTSMYPSWFWSPKHMKWYWYQMVYLMYHATRSPRKMPGISSLEGCCQHILNIGSRPMYVFQSAGSVRFWRIKNYTQDSSRNTMFCRMQFHHIGGYETSHTRRIGPDGGNMIKIVVVDQQHDR
jgi:hypothetical protein